MIVEPLLGSLFWEPERLLHPHYRFFRSLPPALAFENPRSGGDLLPHFNDRADARDFEAVHLSEVRDDIGLCELDGDAERGDVGVVSLAWPVADEAEDEVRKVDVLGCRHEGVWERRRGAAGSRSRTGFAV